jgi:transposase
MPPKRTLPNPDQATLEDLKNAKLCAPTDRSFLRLFAIHQLLEGVDFKAVAKSYGKGERTLQRWISAWNEGGIDALIERPKTGRPRSIPEDKIPLITNLLEHPEKADETHWTARKLHGFLRKEFDLDFGYSTLTRTLREQRYRLKYPRPMPDQADEEQQIAFCNTVSALQRDTDVELWFQDESGFEGDPRPRRRWIKVGLRGTVPKNGWHLRRNAAGLVCPRTGEAFLCSFSHSDTDSFQAFLNEANKFINFNEKRQIMVLDNATWHKSKQLDWGRFEPMYLPPYSPNLNPIERLWKAIKDEWFSDYIAKSQDQLNERLHDALLWAIGRTEGNKKTCRITTNL